MRLGARGNDRARRKGYDAPAAAGRVGRRVAGSLEVRAETDAAEVETLADVRQTSSEAIDDRAAAGEGDGRRRRRSTGSLRRTLVVSALVVVGLAWASYRWHSTPVPVLKCSAHWPRW